MKVMTAVEKAIKLLINTPMAMVKAVVTAVPAKNSAVTGNNMKQPIISLPFP